MGSNEVVACITFQPFRDQTNVSVALEHQILRVHWLECSILILGLRAWQQHLVWGHTPRVPWLSLPRKLIDWVMATKHLIWFRIASLIVKNWGACLIV